jgi:hypothetical protein
LHRNSQSEPGCHPLAPQNRVVLQIHPMQAHFILTAIYRPQTNSRAKLRAVAVPFVIVTATAQPVLLDTVLDNFQTSLALLHCHAHQPVRDLILHRTRRCKCGVGSGTFYNK